jgi:hypothetical protein
MDRNAQDAEFVYKGGQFVYFVDADVAATFAAPKSNLYYFNQFSAWLDEVLLLSTATLTLEYIFSGSLPGQLGKTLITPDHYTEFDAMAGAIRRLGKSKSEAVERDDSPKWKQDLTKLVKAYKANEIPPEAALSALEKTLPEAILDLLRGPVAEAEQLNRLIATELMVRADTTKWFTADIFAPDSKEVGRWNRLLLDSLKRVSKRDDRRIERNVNRDARSLVQILSLVREHRENNDRELLRFVLITGDSSIRRAYNDYRFENRGEKVSVEIRHPMDFSPLLNLGAMGTQDRTLVLQNIENALRALLIRVPLEGRPELQGREIKEAPAYLGGLPRKGKGAPKSQAELIEELKLQWAEAARTALAINGSFIRRRDEAQFNAFVEILESPNVVDAALARLNALIDTLSSRHLVMAVQGIVTRYLRQTRRRVNLEPEFGTRRAPLHVRVTKEFETLIHDGNIHDYLDNLWRGKTEVDYEELARMSDRGVSYLFGACVAIAAEDWLSAKSFAQRAVELLPARPETEQEARYCWALAIRFSMKSYKDARFARELLSICEKFHKENGAQLRRIRDITEKGAIIRAFLYQSRLDPNFDRSESPSVEKLWNDAWDELIDAADSIDSLDGRSRSNRPERLALQIYTNLAELAIYAKSYMRNSMKSDEQYSGISEELKDRIDQWATLVANDPKISTVPYTARAFSGMLNFFLAESAQRRKEAAYETTALLEKHRKVSSDLPELDRMVYEELLSHLALIS